MTRHYSTGLLMLALLLVAGGQPMAESDGIDPSALIERILMVDARQRSELQDVTFDAEFVEGEQKDEGFVEKVKLIKTVYIKYLPDTAWFHEEFLEYYKDGERKSEKDLLKEAKDRREKKVKRGSRDISYPMLKPFTPERSDDYEIDYMGINETAIDGYLCHHFQVDSKIEDDQHVDADYYFDADSFQLVRVDFSPAKLVKKMMFKLNQLQMSIQYAPTSDGYWLPSQFKVKGKGKAAFFFGVDFEAREYYRNPRVNTGLDDSLFVGGS